jgi:hypothetical protein
MLKKHSCISVLIAICLLSSGCAALIIGAGAGTAGALWYKGRLVETVPASALHVHQAIRAGLKDMKIHITEDRADALTAEVRGVLADGRKVSIDATSESPSTTKITIRVGVIGEIGDKEFSLRIRDAIRRHL